MSVRMPPISALACSVLERIHQLTLAQAAQIAETSGPGRAVKAELKQSGTRVFYEIEIIDKVNRLRNIRVDAETGKVIKSLTLP